MKTPAFGLLAALLVLPAARTDAAESSPFQVALHAGYRAGGSLEDMTTGGDRDLDDAESFALALEFRAGKGDDRYAQVWYARQESEVHDGTTSHDVRVDVLHVGGTVPFGELGRAQPYFGAGLGATRFSASGPNAGDKTKLSGSLAVGLALPIGERAALRLEGRGYVTAVDSDSSFLCRSDDGTGFCRIVAHGSAIVQVEALAGIALRF